MTQAAMTQHSCNQEGPNQAKWTASTANFKNQYPPTGSKVVTMQELID